MRTPRSAVITGGGTGLGRASAVALNRLGWDVTIVGRRPEVLRVAAAEIAEAGGGLPVATEVADVGQPDGGAAAVDAHVTRIGGIDALIACAGSYEPTQLTALTAQTWDATMNAQLRGAVLSAAAAARHMTEAGSGRIVPFRRSTASTTNPTQWPTARPRRPSSASRDRSPSTWPAPA